jgi:hypothetical protein
MFMFFGKCYIGLITSMMPINNLCYRLFLSVDISPMPRRGCRFVGKENGINFCPVRGYPLYKWVAAMRHKSHYDISTKR